MHRRSAQTPRRRRSRVQRVVGVGAALIALIVLITPGDTGAAWVATVANSGNQFLTGASFPNFQTSVTNDGALAYHREEEAPSAAATLTAADSSGNARPGTFAGTTDGPSTWWKLDENAGGTAADSSGGANPGTLTNSPTWAPGPFGSALNFNGATTYVAAASRAVHTNASLTVAAWVKLTSTAADGVIVSQNGSHTIGFALGFDSASSKFTFRMSDSDVATPVMKTQYSGVVTTGFWYDLIGVYDTAAHKIYLYVNGVGGNAGKTVNWDATGALQVGREYLNDAWGSYFNGKVEDVRVYGRALSGTEITNLANGSPNLEWDFSEGSGATTADSGPAGNTGTFGGGAGAPTWTGGEVGNGIATTGSANGYVQSATQPVNTNAAALSVSVWAYLSSASAAGTRRVVVSDAGTVSSGFLLYADTSNKWSWALPQSDVANPTLDLAQSNGVAATDTWVHLVGVYDPNGGIHSVSLYVNGVLQTTASSHPSAFAATGNVQVGRALWGGAYTYPWYGSVDSVRVYQRALSAADVTALHSNTEPAATWTEAAMSLGVIGALQGTQSGSTAAAFAGSAFAYNNTSVANPTPFTVECWLRVAGSRGGEVIGFHTDAADDAGSHDRTLYVDSGGRLTFGTYVGSAQTVRTPSAYTDATWHYAAASLGVAGMKLYVDGVLVAASATTTAGNYTGYWRWGGGTLATMPNRPTSDYLTGSIDEVAIYPTQLSDGQITLHYQRNY